MVSVGVTMHHKSKCKFSLFPFALGKEVSHYLSAAHPALPASKTADGNRPWPGLALETVLEGEGLIHTHSPPLPALAPSHTQPFLIHAFLRPLHRHGVFSVPGLVPRAGGETQRTQLVPVPGQLRVQVQRASHRPGDSKDGVPFV